MFNKLGASLIKNVVGTTTYPIPSFVASSIPNAIFPAKSVAGTSYYVPGSVISSGGFSNEFRTSITETGNAGIAVGSGNTAATENDYNLETLITTLTGTVNVTYGYDSTNLRNSVQVALTLTNNTEAAITVKEVGRFVKCYTTSTQGGSASGSSKLFLVQRDVLETPLEIAAGASAVLRIDYIYPGATD